MSRIADPANRYQPPRIPEGQGPSRLAWATLVLGVGTWIFIPIAGAVAAVMCGLAEHRKILEGTSAPEGEKLVTWGVRLAAVQLVLVALILAGTLLFLALLLLSALMG